VKKLFVGIIAAFCISSANADYPAVYLDQPILTDWTCTWCNNTATIPYIIGGNVFLDNPSAPSHTFPVVGAQFNAHALAGTHQIVFGIATEAWSHEDSLSIVIGNESSAINVNPYNFMKKISYFATFKNRGDGEYWSGANKPAANENSVAFRVESQPGTGFGSVIALSKNSVHKTSTSGTALIDLREMDMQDVKDMDLIAFPDGCALRYIGRGQTTVICK
jgi:hypothetical protein